MPALLTKMMAAGLPAGLIEVLTDTADSQTAAGTNQATAHETSTAVVRYTTVASGTGCLLDNGARGDSQLIINDGANALSVYPPTGHTINGLSANAAFSIAAGGWCFFDHVTATRWIGGTDASSSTFTQSGSGAVSRTVQAAMRAITRSGDYDSTANFNTGTDALTETIGINIIQAPAGSAPAGAVSTGLRIKFPTNGWDTKDTVLTFAPYEFGMAIALAGSGQNHDNRLECWLGSADTTEPELSVRHNGNNKGAIIQARNATDTDGMQMIFYSDNPGLRYGGIGPYSLREEAGRLVQRNRDTVGEAQLFELAKTWTEGGLKEYLRLGCVGSNFVVRTAAESGGTQRSLLIDGSTIQLQSGGTARWNVDTSGHLVAATDASFDIGASGATRPRNAFLSGSLTWGSDSVGRLTRDGGGDAVIQTQTATNLRFQTNGSAAQFRVAHTASAVNYVEVTGSASAAGLATITAGGTDTNIDIAITPKGSGVLKFGTHSALATETVSGYITIKDAAGNSRKVAVVS